MAQEFTSAGGKLMSRYGGYDLFEISQLPPAAVTNAEVEFESDGDLIKLHSGVLDTRSAALKSHPNLAAPSFTGKRLHLVQFAGPPKPEWIAELTNANLRIVSYIPENAYLVYGEAGAIRKLQSMAAAGAHYQWEGAYEGKHKVHPAARATQQAKTAAGAPEPNLYAIQLVADAEANSTTLQLLDQLKQEPLTRQNSVLGYVNIVARLSPADLDQVASQPDVVSIQTYVPRTKNCERQSQILAGNLTGTKPTGPGYLNWLTSKGFTQAQFDASGFVVDVSDSGIDNGTTSPNHFGLYSEGNLSGKSRVVYDRLIGTRSVGSTLAGCDGHGTLNTHILAGYDNTSGFPFTDSAGFHYGLGVCPFVQVGSSVVFDPQNFTNPKYQDVQSQAYRSGARISNNSWGGGANGAYDIDAQEFDALVRDAQPGGAIAPAPGNQEMVIVFSAGNDGPTLQSVGSPGTAKNVITVGASENVQAFGGSDSSGVTDSQANSANDMVAFSSRGPCSDGRHKPDLVAAGTHVSGGVYQRLNPSSVGTAAACYDGTGVSGGVNSSFFPAGQEYYTASSGTSHATPGVTGGAALLRQYFINQSITPPSPAMTKAYLMNSARYLTGASANDTLWSDNQGMGEMNLGTAFDGTPRVLRDQEAADMFTASGQSRTFSGNITDSTKPFRVTVAWTDAPGTTAGNAYNNDLDLRVTVNGVLYKGNVFSGQWSTTGGNADTKNNVETVSLPPGTTGSFTVQVLASNINSDGVPQNSTLVDQDFALVIYNAALESKPVLAPAGSALVGESFPSNGAVDPGETVNLSFSLVNAGTAPTANLIAELLPTGGVSSPSSAQSYGVLLPGGAAVEKNFTFVANGDCGSPLTATLQLRDGTKDLGTVQYAFTLGKFTTTTVFTENFDTVSPPALPAAWVSSVSGAASPWVTTAAVNDTAPNSLSTDEAADVGLADLISPTIAIGSSAAKLSFRTSYDIEADDVDQTLAYDGGVLEIKIGTGQFTDILQAGGTFSTGGYTRTIDPTGDNPLSARKAWSGKSGGFITTQVNLPPAAVGKSVQFRWRLGTDTGNFYGGVSWQIDSVSVVDGSYTCSAATAAPTLLNFSGSNGQFSFSLQTIAGQSYTVEYADSLNSTNWQPLQTITGTGSTVVVTDQSASQQRFYRVRTP